MLLPTLSRQCISLPRATMGRSSAIRSALFRQKRHAEVVSMPSTLGFNYNHYGRIRQIATEATRVKVDYDAKYAEKLNRVAKEKGITVEELKQKLKEEAKAKRQTAAPKPKTEKPAVAAKPSAAPQSPEAVAAKSHLPYESSAPTLDKIVKLDLLQKEDADTISRIWTEFHANKDCISATIPKDTYDTLFARSQKYPMFIVPMPRESGVEFFFMQFNFHQCYFTSLLEYKAKGTEARPFLTITHFPELADTKGIVLMKGEISDNPRMIDTQNAQFLAFAVQQFYATGGEAKFKLVEKFHTAPDQFDYQELMNEVERVI